VPATLTSVQTVPCQDAEPGPPGSTRIKVRARPDGGGLSEAVVGVAPGDSVAVEADTGVWVEGDPEPVVETADSFDGLPRVTYRPDAGELDRLRAALGRSGLAGATLTPRRSRAHRH
jgi:hypothetical protein